MSDKAKEDPIVYAVFFEHCNREWEMRMSSPRCDICPQCGQNVEPIGYEEEEDFFLDMADEWEDIYGDDYYGDDDDYIKALMRRNH